MDAAQFRLDFPEFASTTNYPDSSIGFWLRLGNLLILESIWDEVQPFGLELFVAHNLALERAAAAGGAGGGAPGMNQGVVSGKTVDKLSVTYNATVGLEKDAGHWNLTTYGARFINLARLAGMRPYQAGAGPAYLPPGSIVVVGGSWGPGWPYAA